MSRRSMIRPPQTQVLPPSQQPLIVTVEEEPCFDLGVGSMPVSRDIPPAQRQIIVRHLKQYSAFEAFMSAGIYLSIFAGISAVVCVIFGFLYILIKHT